MASTRAAGDGCERTATGSRTADHRATGARLVERARLGDRERRLGRCGKQRLLARGRLRLVAHERHDDGEHRAGHEEGAAERPEAHPVRRGDRPEPVVVLAVVMNPVFATIDLTWDRDSGSSNACAAGVMPKR